MITASAKYWIIKPVDQDWKVFGSKLFDLRKQYFKALNLGTSLLFSNAALKTPYQRKQLTQDLREVCNGFSGRLFDSVKSECWNKWVNNKSDILKGQKKLTSFKEDYPISIRDTGFKLYKEDNNYIVELNLYSKVNEDNWVKFLFHPSKDKEQVKDKSNPQKSFINSSSRKVVIDRIINDIYDTGDVKIIYDKRKRSWYLIISYKFEPIETDLDYDRYIGVDLGYNNAIYCAVSDSLERVYTHHFNELLRQKALEFYKKRKQILNANKKIHGLRGGHGRKKKLQPLEKFYNKYKNFQNTMCHCLSKTVVDFALQKKAGNIVLEELSGIKDKGNVLLKNWPIFLLQSMIENKAAKYGIKVFYIHPGFTSQSCSNCNYTDSENRKQENNWEKFKCLKCGYEEHADYNGAKNIIKFFLFALAKNQIALDIPGENYKGDKNKSNDFFGRIASVKKTKIKLTFPNKNNSDNDESFLFKDEVPFDISM